MSVDGVYARIGADLDLRHAALTCLAVEERTDVALVLAVLAVCEDLDSIRQAIEDLHETYQRRTETP